MVRCIQLRHITKRCGVCRCELDDAEQARIRAAMKQERQRLLRIEQYVQQTMT